MALKGLWGPDENENFEILPAGSPLTDNFDDNAKIANLRQTDTFILYIDYKRGAETRIEIRMRYSLLNDAPPGEDFFEESVVDNDTGQVTPFIHYIDADGKYRLGVPLGIREDRVEISVRGVGAGGPYDGEVKLHIAPNNPRFQQATGFRR